jgi:aminomethyltransferase
MRTPLYDEHVSLGARIVDFHGWDMPIEYSRIIDEHIAVRKSAGIFDVSHMGDIIISGLDAGEFIDHLFPTDVTSLKSGQCIYTAFLNENASIIDDTIIYKLNDRKYFFVPNAANIDIIFNWLKKNVSGYDVEIKNVSDDIACIAIQGPMYEEVLKGLGYRTVKPFTFSFEKSNYKNAITGGNDVIISGTGYTGEKGVEIICPADEAVEIWKKSLDGLRKVNGKPCGLGSRDTLRMEKGMLLSGVDFNNDKTPYECSISFIVSNSKEFIGKKRLEERKSIDNDIFRGFISGDRSIPRSGFAIYSGDNITGNITSGTFSPILQKSIALGYIKKDSSKPGTEVLIDIRGKKVKAMVSRPRMVP